MADTSDMWCPVCADRVVEANTPNPYHKLLGCVSCRHAVVSPVELRDNADEVQLKHFGDAFATRSGFFVALYEGINARRTVRAMRLGPKSRVLEVGPGSGSVMGRLAYLGHDVRGLELSPAVARHIRQRWNLPVDVEPLDVHVESVGEGVYDAIVLRHVLEHFCDPVDALVKTHALLKPEGQVYIAVPNMDSWHRCFLGWSGYEPYHVHFFGAQSMSLALWRAGFQLREAASFESLTGWVNTFLRTAKDQGDRHSAPATTSGWKRWVLEAFRLLTGIALSPLRWLQSRLGRGEELVVIAVKTIT